MQDESKIQALLATNAPENQILAVQLIQSQWNWLLEEALVYGIDFYCKTNETELKICLGDVEIEYLLEIVDDYHFIMRSEVLLTFKLKRQGQILRQETVVNEKIEPTENRFLKHYMAPIKASFEKELLGVLVLVGE